MELLLEQRELALDAQCFKLVYFSVRRQPHINPFRLLFLAFHVHCDLNYSEYVQSLEFNHSIRVE